MKSWISVTAIAAIGLLAVWLCLPEANTPSPAPTAEGARDRTSGEPAFTSPLKDSVGSISRAEQAEPRAEDTQTSSPGPDPAAIRALRETRDGDPRAPEIGVDQRSRAQRDSPPPSDYRDYLSIQHELQRRHHAAYVHAAKEKLAEIEEQLEWGRANGVPEEQLEMAREKRQRLAEARQKLLEEDPALETDFPEPLNPER